MSEVNIDVTLVRGGDAALSRTDERLVEKTNGCICCTLRDDLLLEVKRLAEEGRFDDLLIESSGLSEPLPEPVLGRTLPLPHGGPRGTLTRRTWARIVECSPEYGTASNLLCFGMQPDSQGSQNLEDRIKRRGPLTGQRLVEALSRKPCIPGHLAHPLGPRDVS